MKNHLKTLKLEYRPFNLSFIKSFSEESTLAISSFEVSDQNIVDFYDINNDGFINNRRFFTKFPQSKIMFNPAEISENNNMLVSSGESLKIFKVEQNDIILTSDLHINQTKAIITSFDWCKYSENIIITVSTDTTASVLDINKGEFLTQIVAHETPIFDICFCNNSSTFITSGFDGSVRFFDLRDVQSCIIYYKASMPILRASMSPSDSQKVAFFGKGSNICTVIDTRRPCVPFARSASHGNQISSLKWSSLLQTNLLYSSDIAGNLVGTNFGLQKMEPLELHIGDCIENFVITNKVLATACPGRVDLFSLPQPQVADNLTSSLGPM